MFRSLKTTLQNQPLWITFLWMPTRDSSQTSEVHWLISFFFLFFQKFSAFGISHKRRQDNLSGWIWKVAFRCFSFTLSLFCTAVISLADNILGVLNSCISRNVTEAWTEIAMELVCRLSNVSKYSSLVHDGPQREEWRPSPETDCVL